MASAESAVLRHVTSRILAIQRQSIAASSAPLTLIGYCCDIEGNLQYWNNYLSISQVLRRDGGFIVLRDHCHFVFGGDVCDRGVGDIRVIRELVELKSRYPERVHLLMGNRDINKMRMRFELADYTLATSMGNVYWVPKTLTIGETKASKLNWMLQNTLGCPLTFELRRQELRELKGQSDVSDEDVVESFPELVVPEGLLTRYLAGAKLGLVLGDAFFCHGALTSFNIRKIPPSYRSCGNLTGHADVTTAPPGAAASSGWRICPGTVQEWTDELNGFAEEEIQHYIEFSSEYLARMQRGEFDTESPLPSPPDSPMIVPSLSYSSTHTPSAGSEPERTGNSKIDSRSGGCYWAHVGGYTHPQPGSRLLQYGMGWMPNKTKNPSVVYENWLNEDGQPQLPSDEVMDYLKDSGIRYVITGHQPHGDAPLVLSGQDAVCIAADTSYATNVKWERDDFAKVSASSRESIDRSNYIPEYEAVVDAGVTRGFAVSEVCFELESDSASTDAGESLSNCKIVTAFSHGILSNGCSYVFPIQPDRAKSLPLEAETSRIMTNGDLGDGWWIKGLAISPPPRIYHDSIETFPESDYQYMYLASKSAKFSVLNKFFPSGSS